MDRTQRAVQVSDLVRRRTQEARLGSVRMGSRRRGCGEQVRHRQLNCRHDCRGLTSSPAGDQNTVVMAGRDAQRGMHIATHVRRTWAACDPLARSDLADPLKAVENDIDGAHAIADALSSVDPQPPRVPFPRSIPRDAALGCGPPFRCGPSAGVRPSPSRRQVIARSRVSRRPRGPGGGERLPGRSWVAPRESGTALLVVDGRHRRAGRPADPVLPPGAAPTDP